MTGRFIETLGWYDPKREGENFKLKTDRIQEWIGKGAMVSDSVKSLLKRERGASEGLMKAFITSIGRGNGGSPG